MRKILFTLLSAICLNTTNAQRLYVTPLADNAARVRYAVDSVSKLPELVYLPNNFSREQTVGMWKNDGYLDFYLTWQSSSMWHAKLAGYSLSGDTAFASFKVSDDEYLFGLGQFQDGYSNLNGLPRRLTQVNTQISMPVLISNKGYGIVWNNYSKTEFNLPDNKVELKKTAAEGAAEPSTLPLPKAANKKPVIKIFLKPKSPFPKAANTPCCWTSDKKCHAATISTSTAKTLSKCKTFGCRRPPQKS